MLISIITVNYNNLEGLKRTFASVKAQDSSVYEHIVIDGGSTDGSAAFLQSNESCFSYWVSEKDHGIYHAMNKGVEKCTGDYIYFLNSGDTFYSNSVISAFVNEQPIADLVYGDVNVLLLNGLNTVKKMPAHLTIGSTLTNTITHQAIFHKKALFDAQGYDETYKIIADWIFYNEVILIKKGSYKHIDVVVANFESGGLSSNVTAAELERERYLKTKFSPYFYDLLTEYNTLQIRYKNINSLFFVRWYTQFKNFIKKVVK